MKTADVIEGITWGLGIIAVALTASVARKLGFLEGDTAERLVIGLNGLMVTWYGNRMPKAFVPNAQARRARRVGGWSMVVSGLAYAGLWAFAPIGVATSGGMLALLAGIAVTLGYCLSLRLGPKAA
ncbi:MAG: ammonium transporter [Proteobacteria bacterium]|nr:ammonium transporter [Pseudomonadota bacterium]